MKQFAVALVLQKDNKIHLSHVGVSANNEHEALGFAIAENEKQMPELKGFGLVMHSVIEVPVKIPAMKTKKAPK